MVNNKKNKIKKCNLGIELPPVEAFAYETHPDLPKLCQQILVNGARGSGKTIAAVNLMKKFDFDRIFLVSPTARSNHAILSMLEINPDDIYDDPDDPDIIDNIKAEIEAEAEAYDLYHEQMEKYKEFLKYKKRYPFKIPDELLIEFFDPDTKSFIEPQHWLNGRRCRMAILFDDIVGSRLFSKGVRKVNALAILHRHVGPVKAEGGGALGVSTFYLSQTYTIQTGGITKAIRNNTTSVILFKSKSEKELKQIEDELAGEVGPEIFRKVYEYAVNEPHSFLFIDLHPKEHHPSKFRKRFDEFIIVDELKKVENV
jgi:hypothetical protein